MIKISEENQRLKIENRDESANVLAKASVIRWNKNALCQFIDDCIKEEIESIRAYDLIDDLSDEEILIEFKENFVDLYDIKSWVSKDDKVAFIDFIENCSGVRFAARDIIDFLKKEYDKIMLYSDSEAIGYWENLDFKALHLDTIFGYNFKQK